MRIASHNFLCTIPDEACAVAICLKALTGLMHVWVAEQQLRTCVHYNVILHKDCTLR